MNQVEFLAGLGLNANAPGLVAIAAEVPQEPRKPKPDMFPENAHSMPITSIVWDEKWVAEFDLETQFADASRFLFAAFRSAGRDKDRHSLLHSSIGRFLVSVRRARKAGVPHTVTANVKASRPEREMAAVLAAAGVSEDELAEFLRKRKENI